jgi:hypothetical protein
LLRKLAEQIEILKCVHNFVRPHQALRFGKTTRTPAVQAALTTRKLSLRNIFLSFRPHGPAQAGSHRWGSAFQGLDIPLTKSRGRHVWPATVKR